MTATIFQLYRDCVVPHWLKTLTAFCSPAEQQFMEASMAYTAGKGYLSDKEYDDLKRELQDQNSKVVQQVCSRDLLESTAFSSQLGCTAQSMPTHPGILQFAVQQGMAPPGQSS